MIVRLVFALLATGLSVSALRAADAPPARRTLPLPEVRLHDPFILTDPATRTYHLYTSAPVRLTGTGRAGTFCYTSRDLATWEGPHLVFVCPEDSWADATQMAWAPEVHAYRGKYYLFTTLHQPARPLESPMPSRPLHMRATIIAVSDSPLGPFTLLKTDAPVTPPDFMTLDGTLYVDRAGRPWMAYAHEWLQKVDGTLEAIPLSDDLAAATRAPIHLLKASDAPWLNAQIVPNPRPAHYVTDGPQFFRTRTGRLLMLWSSYRRNEFGNDGYVQTIARSQSDEIQGPWVQLEPLVGNDSGHGMIFRSFEDQLMLIVHQPFQNARGKLYDIEDLGDTVRLVRYRDDLSGPALGPQKGQTPR